jgi:hypothetical protein
MKTTKAGTLRHYMYNRPTHQYSFEIPPKDIDGIQLDVIAVIKIDEIYHRPNVSLTIFFHNDQITIMDRFKVKDPTAVTIFKAKDYKNMMKLYEAITIEIEQRLNQSTIQPV